MIAGVLLVALFSKEVSNSDFWWHLKTGQYISQTHSLPDPDPFAYTTATAGEAYPGETLTRQFNLTHEWLAQILIYLTYRAAGFPGIVLARAMLLAAFCGLVGWIVYQRCRGFYRSLGAVLAAASVAYPFAEDRPFLVSFFLLALTIAILEWRSPPAIYLLPLILLIWANSHGGFILGWAAMVAYCAESAILHLRGRPQAGAKPLWIVCAISVLISGWNPNGFRIVQVLANYHKSDLTSNLLEWGKPSLWPISPFSALLLAGSATLLWAHRRVRLADWFTFAMFAAASLYACRNTILIGLPASIVLATYLPWQKLRLGRYAEYGAGLSLIVAVATVVSWGQSFQLRAATWDYPSGAADFLLANHLNGLLFNTYEYGGYLAWRLWPFERVFIDGRALSESLFRDYRRALYCADDRPCAGAIHTLDRYGVDIVVMNLFEYTSGQAYVLAPALADPASGWSMAYADAQAVVLIRHPSPSLPVLDPSRMLAAMESGCDLHIRHEPQLAGCARNLGQMYSNIGDFINARRWLGIYLQHAALPDAEAQDAFQRMTGNNN